MSKHLLLLFIFLASIATSSIAATKKVCKEDVVKGKKVEQCRSVKIHKKFNGVKVPSNPSNKGRK